MTRRPVDEILRYWLEEVGPRGWYAADPARDADIRTRFLGDWHQAARGALHPWLATPRSSLALLVLLDQFSRNIFRGQGEAFSADAGALAAARTAIGLRHDRHIPEPERQFFYLPFMHSERLADQERCIRLIQMRMPETGAVNLEHGAQHRAVIRQFGRFPSRNAPLGRRDTAAEHAYRAAGGYMG